MWPKLQNVMADACVVVFKIEARFTVPCQSSFLLIYGLQNRGAVEKMSRLHARLRQLMAKPERCIGSWVMSRDPITTEILAQSGFDWLAIDLEHAPITLSEAADLIRTGNGCDCPMLVRMPGPDFILAKQLLDAGASGFIFPDVRTVEAAQSMARAMRYPYSGEGERGVGLGRAAGYGRDFEDYFRTWNDAVCLIAQIEHVDALECVDEIAAIDGVDGLFVGPYDMSSSMGIAGQLDHPELIAAVDRVIAAARQAGKHAGFHAVPVDVKNALSFFDRGATLLAYSADVFMVRQCADEFIQAART